MIASASHVRAAGLKWRSWLLDRGSVWVVGLILVALGLASTAAPVEAQTACPNQQLRAGSSVNLPDCRAYEQVSPVEKGGFDSVSTGPRQYPADGAPSGEAVAYMGLGPLPGALGSGLPHAHLSTRTEAGWSTTEVTPATKQATPAGGWYFGYDFSEDLSKVVLKVPQQALTEDVPPGAEHLYNLFLREREGGYSLVNSAPPTVLPPPNCLEVCQQETDTSAFAGASQDFSRILFEADDSLVGTGAPAGSLTNPIANLYENVEGQLHLVGILPDGVIAPEGAVAGAGGAVLGGVKYSSEATGAWRDVNHAMSSDGTRVLFEAAADGGAPEPAQKGMVELYDRVNGVETIEVSQPAQGATPANSAPQPAQFRGASEDGTHVLFTSKAELTTQSNTGATNEGQDLYRYDPPVGKASPAKLIDLSVDTNPADAATGAGVLGVVGNSRDGSYVYFVATGELLAGQGVDGQPNLYVWHEDLPSGATELRFVATLSEADKRDWTEKPVESQAYLTPDGRHLAFMSLASLTGYNNLDRESGNPDSEVYEYAGDSRSVQCVSCDASGAQPSGSSFIGATMKRTASTPFHQSRVLSDDGRRLFFSSVDALAAGAANRYVKVYEHEQAGAGSCETESGCTYLISSGEATSDDAFLDASASGGDVFIATLGRLVPGDGDNLLDVYDARVDGGVVVATVSESCSSACQPSREVTPPPPLLSGSTGLSGNLLPVPSTLMTPSVRAKAKRPPCRMKALRIKHNPKARRRALKRCRQATQRAARKGKP